MPGFIEGNTSAREGRGGFHFGWRRFGATRHQLTQAAGMFSHTHHDSLIVFAPAKINLFLEVLGRRDDGFHELLMVMTPVRLFDTLRLRAREDGQIDLTAEWSCGANQPTTRAQSAAGPVGPTGPTLGDLPAAEDNLVTKALRLLQSTNNCQLGADVELTKRIPAAAGLGGASSDAAAALWAGNQLWQLGLNREQLADLANQLGSDIAFFLLNDGGPAVCRGRGELVEPCRLPAGQHVVVARPPVALSTADVFRNCTPASQPRKCEPLLTALAAGRHDGLRATMTNRLAKPAADLTPWMSRLREEFNQTACLAHQMTGSGSCYFGLFATAPQARRAAARLRTRGIGQIWYTQTC